MRQRMLRQTAIPAPAFLPAPLLPMQSPPSRQGYPIADVFAQPPVHLRVGPDLLVPDIQGPRAHSTRHAGITPYEAPQCVSIVSSSPLPRIYLST